MHESHVIVVTREGEGAFLPSGEEQHNIQLRSCCLMLDLGCQSNWAQSVCTHRAALCFPGMFIYSFRRFLCKWDLKQYRRVTVCVCKEWSTPYLALLKVHFVWGVILPECYLPSRCCISETYCTGGTYRLDPCLCVSNTHHLFKIIFYPELALQNLAGMGREMVYAV